MLLSTGFSSRMKAHLQTGNVRSLREKMLQIPMDMGWSSNFPNSKMHSEPVIKKAAPTNAALVHLPSFPFVLLSISKAKRAARRSTLMIRLTFPWRQASVCRCLGLSSLAMSRAFRTLLLWLLIVALPLQGVAAVIRVSCPDQAATHTAHGGHHAEHDMQMDVAQHDASSTLDIHQTKNHGSSCASCCIGIAALPALPAAPSASPESEPPVATATPFPSTAVLSGLERPPKHSLS